MFDMVLDRFLVPRDPWKRLKDPVRRLAHGRSAALHPIRLVVDRLKRALNAGLFAVTATAFVALLDSARRHGSLMQTGE